MNRKQLQDALREYRRQGQTLDVKLTDATIKLKAEYERWLAIEKEWDKREKQVKPIKSAYLARTAYSIIAHHINQAFISLVSQQYGVKDYNHVGNWFYERLQGAMTLLTGNNEFFIRFPEMKDKFDYPCYQESKLFIDNWLNELLTPKLSSSFVFGFTNHCVSTITKNIQTKLWVTLAKERIPVHQNHPIIEFWSWLTDYSWMIKKASELDKITCNFISEKVSNACNELLFWIDTELLDFVPLGVNIFRDDNELVAWVKPNAINIFTLAWLIKSKNRYTSRMSYRRLLEYAKVGRLLAQM